MLDPTGRVAIVSGANRGIGRALALRLASVGWRLSLGARQPETLNTAFGPDTEDRRHFRFDALDRVSFSDWVAGTLSAFGRIDALVNNAGTSNKFTIENGNEADLDALWAINVKGPLFMTRFCLPYLRVSGQGRILNVASLSGKRVRNENVAYNMTKHALIALSHGTRRIGWEDGIRVTTLCPSFVRTDLTADATKVKPDAMIPPEDLAELAITALALPNNTAIPELLVNCRLEDQF
jgi:NAD(P)-dependent dehydrogenase (short-subunit alcohol dehydrogenase family)